MLPDFLAGLAGDLQRSAGHTFSQPACEHSKGLCPCQSSQCVAAWHSVQHLPLTDIGRQVYTLASVSLNRIRYAVTLEVRHMMSTTIAGPEKVTFTTEC